MIVVKEKTKLVYNTDEYRTEELYGVSIQDVAFVSKVISDCAAFRRRCCCRCPSDREYRCEKRIKTLDDPDVI